MQAPATIYSERPDPDTMGGRLSRARDAAGLGIADLARQVGVKVATIQSWECDRAQPRSNRIATLAGMLNVSISWILHGVGTGPDEDGGAELLRNLVSNVESLKRLRDESDALLAQIEDDLRRIAVVN